MITLSMNYMKTITGHFYELVEYYWYLSHFDLVEILLYTDIDKELLGKAISTKYNFSLNDLNIKIYKEKPKILKGDILLQVDGRFDENTIYYYNKIFSFRCSPRFKYFPKKTVLLLDKRIYDDLDDLGGIPNKKIHYKKKIAFEIFKEIPKKPDKKYLLYLTTSRNYDIDKIIYTPKLIIRENEIIEDLFSKFQTYIYTPTEHNFDCSSRFLAECYYYNKDVIFWLKDTEWNKGLYYRVKDIETCFDTLKLTKKDELWGILNT